MPWKELVFNLDKFLVLLGPNRQWTWQGHRKGEFQLEKRHLGLLAQLSRMLQAILIFLQLIWEGSIGVVHAKMDAQDPKIIQKKIINPRAIFRMPIPIHVWCVVAHTCSSMPVIHSTAQHTTPQ